MIEADVFKPSNVKRAFFIDYRVTLIKSWGPSRRYDNGDIVRAPTNTGFYYKVVTQPDGGVSSANQPQDWSIVPTTTIKDGSVLWTTFHPDSAGLFTISSSVWRVDAGITVVDDTNFSRFIVEREVADGVSGQFYQAINDAVTADGREVQKSIIIGVQDPVPL